MATQFTDCLPTPTLRSAMMEKLAAPRERQPDTRQFALPQGLRVVSADNHMGISKDIWYEGFPEHLKHAAPRVLFDGGLWTIRQPCAPCFADMSPIEQIGHRIFESHDIPGNTDLDVRMADLAVEGHNQEIVYPQLLGGYFGFADLEVREWIFRIYNQHLANLQAEKPGQFYGVGIPNYWDMSKARESIQEIKSLGLKTFMLPRIPGKDPQGREIIYSNPECKPLWDAIEEGGLPISFHIGEGAMTGGVNGWSTMLLEGFDAFRRNFAQLVFGGIFDRHPSLKVVFVESGIKWVPSALQDAEMIYDSFTHMFDPLPQHRPTHYWQKHCYAVFMVDPIGLKLLDYVGADRVMWAADYPHMESTFGYSWQAMQEVMDHVTDADARKILGDTARQLYGLP